MAPHKVTVIGSGNWGSAIARIVGYTTAKFPNDFNPTVNMWVHEEIWNGMKLSHIINEQHENPKYLPNQKLPENVVAVTDLVESCKEADVLIFVVPHQFVQNVCKQLEGNLKEHVLAVSLIKDDVLHCHVEGRRRPLDRLGLMAMHKKGGIRLVSEEIEDILHSEIAVLMGANLAHEVANDNFCEATIGYKGSIEKRTLLKKLFQTDNFRINVVKDAHTVELCGALKNIVACAAGITDGLGYGDNTKAAVIRLGLMEITKFVEHFYPGSNLETFFESCGIADLITTCYGGRNRKVCEAFVRTGKPLKEIEAELLKGQSAQGPLCAEEVYEMLVHFQMEPRFPVFCSVHKICSGQMKATDLVECLRHHPEHHRENC